MKKILIIAASVLTVFASCSRKVESGYETIPYVNALLADSLAHLKQLASLSGSSSGTIVLIGEPQECLSVSETLMTCDIFDNIDGRRVKDGLPDFAGETIVPVLDFVNAPYEEYSLTPDGQQFLRELTVRHAVTALDTVCRTNPFNGSLAVGKSPVKILLICSPLLSEYGSADVADLYERIGCDVPVVSAEDSLSFAVETARILREKNLYTHNIAMPATEICQTYPAAGLSEDAYSENGELTASYKYSRKAGMKEQTFITVTFRDKYVPESFTDTVAVLAPTTYWSYVQDQH